jgi:uncharacterized protein YcfL
MKFFINNCLFLISFLGCNAQSEKLLDFEIRMPTENVRNSDDLQVKLIFLNNYSKKPVIIHKHLNYWYEIGVDTIQQDHQIKFEVEKFENGKYKSLESNVSGHLMHVSYSSSDLYDTIHYKKSITHIYPLTALYWFTKGEYRVRAKYFRKELSPKENFFIYSDWTKFTVVTDEQL